MKRDALKQFSKLRTALLTERTRLQHRLDELNSLLGPDLASSLSASAPRKVGRPPGRRRGRRGPRGALSLKAAIVKATSERALTKEEIFAAVKKLGVRFSTPRPMASINAYIYQKAA